jgi:hypothetical protein
MPYSFQRSTLACVPRGQTHRKAMPSALVLTSFMRLVSLPKNRNSCSHNIGGFTFGDRTDDEFSCGWYHFTSSLSGGC